MKKKRSMIWQYIRNRRREKVGILCAKNIGEGKIVIGYSMCNKNFDKFDFVTGMKLAMERLNSCYSSSELPITVNESINKFAPRCLRYFEYKVFVIDNICD